MKVLVTGGAGFIGSHTVDLLVDSGHDVFVIDNLSTGRKENINPKASFLHLDVNNKEVEQLFCNFRPDGLIHLAAKEVSPGNPFKEVMDHITGTIRLLSYCDKYSVKKIIFASSAEVYGGNHPLPLHESLSSSPISYNGVSKFTCECYISLFQQYKKIRYTILRYAKVYGPRQAVFAEEGDVTVFLNNIMENKPITIYGTGEQTMDFIYVKDVAKANIAAITKGDNEIINIGTELSTSINQLFHICNGILKSNLVPKYESAKVEDLPHFLLSNSKARKVLGWKPSYTLEEGLMETIYSLLNP
ncbi:UDP-glucose 4-epimerase [Neobacillus niacini]|uniref:NAD-dependent epimerase/dehydratase family protein n=1 Tax=Neobacillus niacini TaxID=86668 RepID=UPI0027801474|nr:NAD-dependent epimerase/dehydratase family protein [Neobacillus niacini]MDQ1002251.1 UDP-glucose 4-epimerase [Neobacillus niacini]